VGDQGRTGRDVPNIEPLPELGVPDILGSGLCERTLRRRASVKTVGAITATGGTWAGLVSLPYHSIDLRSHAIYFRDRGLERAKIVGEVLFFPHRHYDPLLDGEGGFLSPV
jgi:hypothetical protein